MGGVACMKKGHRNRRRPSSGGARLNTCCCCSRCRRYRLCTLPVLCSAAISTRSCRFFCFRSCSCRGRKAGVGEGWGAKRRKPATQRLAAVARMLRVPCSSAGPYLVEVAKLHLGLFYLLPRSHDAHGGCRENGRRRLYHKKGKRPSERGGVVGPSCLACAARRTSNSDFILASTTAESALSFFAVS